jgi:hypothetical protein
LVSQQEDIEKKKEDHSANELMRQFVLFMREMTCISRLTAEMKETITKKGIKRQRRFTTDTIERIHEKFRLEHTDVKISYSTFTNPKFRYRYVCLQAARKQAISSKFTSPFEMYSLKKIAGNS